MISQPISWGDKTVRCLCVHEGSVMHKQLSLTQLRSLGNEPYLTKAIKMRQEEFALINSVLPYI